MTFASPNPPGRMRTVSLAMLCLLCLGLPLDALSLDGQRTLKALRGENLLKRVRRGWMWNQFFLQEEYTGSDYQYIGKVRPTPRPPAVTSANANSQKTPHVSPFTHRRVFFPLLITLCATCGHIFTCQQCETITQHRSTVKDLDQITHSLDTKDG